MTTLSSSKAFAFNKDKLFQQVFSSIPVFTILFEDNEVEEKFFGVQKDSSILTVTGAGCGVAAHLAHHPERIDAVDANSHHLALTALKIEAVRKINSNEELYQFLGYGKHPNAKVLVKELTSDLPEWMQKYWERRYKVFHKGLYRSGLFHHLIHRMHNMWGMNGEWIKSFMELNEEARGVVVKERYRKVLRKPYVSAVVNSPLLLLAQGINFNQRDKNLQSAKAKKMSDVFFELVDNLNKTDIEKNWILWHCMGGEFNHDHPEARPVYLRKSHHDLSYGSPTNVNYHRESFLNVLHKAPENHWSHYSFSDAMDWMPAEVQKAVLSEVVRTAKENAILINRTVEEDCLIQRLGLQDNFVRMNGESDAGTAMEKSKLYRRTDFYKIKK